MAGDAEDGGEKDKNEESQTPAAVFPPFVDKDAETIEAAPCDEVEGGTMPETAEEHGVHIVDVGAQGFAVRGPEVVEK